MIPSSNCVTRVFGVLVKSVNTPIGDFAVDGGVGSDDFASGADEVLGDVSKHFGVIQRFDKEPWVGFVGCTES